jgi:hypothetical protein
MARCCAAQQTLTIAAAFRGLGVFLASYTTEDEVVAGSRVARWYPGRTLEWRLDKI